MRKFLQKGLLTACFIAVPCAVSAQSNVYSVNVNSTIQELAPEQRARFIADHLFSVGDYALMHTKAFGWTLSRRGEFHQLTRGEVILSGETDVPKSAVHTWAFSILALCIVGIFAFLLRRQFAGKANHDI